MDRHGVRGDCRNLCPTAPAWIALQTPLPPLRPYHRCNGVIMLLIETRALFCVASRAAGEEQQKKQQHEQLLPACFLGVLASIEIGSVGRSGGERAGTRMTVALVGLGFWGCGPARQKACWVCIGSPCCLHNHPPPFHSSAYPQGPSLQRPTPLTQQTVPNPKNHSAVTDHTRCLATSNQPPMPLDDPSAAAAAQAGTAGKQEEEFTLLDIQGSTASPSYRSTASAISVRQTE